MSDGQGDPAAYRPCWRAVAVRKSDWKSEMELMLPFGEARREEVKPSKKKKRISTLPLLVLADWTMHVRGGAFEHMSSPRSRTARVPDFGNRVEAWVETGPRSRTYWFVARCRPYSEHGAAKRARLSDSMAAVDQVAFLLGARRRVREAYEGVGPVSARCSGVGELMVAGGRCWSANRTPPRHGVGC